jgi:hypothetical protein
MSAGPIAAPARADALSYSRPGDVRSAVESPAGGGSRFSLLAGGRAGNGERLGKAGRRVTFVDCDCGTRPETIVAGVNFA